MREHVLNYLQQLLAKTNKWHNFMSRHHSEAVPTQQQQQLGTQSEGNDETYDYITQ